MGRANGWDRKGRRGVDGKTRALCMARMSARVSGMGSQEG